ncbi:MAG: LuxR C-terminal-related transcriptional regulator [Pseudomonadota bacterium]
MPPSSSNPLTDRQLEVMVRIDRRVPIKVIAQDLGVSETRINQHIRALKNKFEAGSLGDLVECYRATLVESKEQESGQVDQVEGSRQEPSAFPLPNPVDEAQTVSMQGLSEATFSKTQVPSDVELSDLSERDDVGDLTVNDIMPMVEQAPWLRPGEPKVVPGVLDGEHATLFRLCAIIVIAFGFLAAVVLTVTTAVSVSEILDGKASIPEDEQSQT